MANINLGTVDTDTWANVLTEVTGTSLAALDPAATSAGANAPVRGYLPTTVAVRARELLVGGRRLHQVVLGGGREGLLWRANLDAEELNGYVEYRQSSGAGAGRVYARLARLTLAPSSTRDVEALLDAQPGSIPALDVVVEELELRGRKLGRVEIEAVNRVVSARDGVAREWRLNRFDVTLPRSGAAGLGQLGGHQCPGQFRHGRWAGWGGAPHGDEFQARHRQFRRAAGRASA